MCPLDGGGEITGDENGEIQSAIHHPAQQLPGACLFHPDLESGITMFECHQARRKVVRAHHVGDPDTHLPPLEPLELSHLGLSLVHLQQQTLGVATEYLPLRRQPYRPVLTVEQAQLELLLQLGNGHADGGLGHMQAVGRPGKRAGIPDRQQIGELFQVHVSIHLMRWIT